MMNEIGTIHINRYDVNKCYIVGASEEANEEFRQRLLSGAHGGAGPKISEEDWNDPLQVKFREKIMSTMRTTTSENYNNIVKIKGMPKSCLGGPGSFDQPKINHR